MTGLMTNKLKQINVAKHSQERVYDISGIARTLMSGVGGFGGKTGLYEVETSEGKSVDV